MAVIKASTRYSATKGDYGRTGDLRLEITNWNEIMKVLVALDKDYVKALRESFKYIGKDVQTAVRKAIPSKGKPPLRNMKQVFFGRLAWSSDYGKGAKPSKSVLLQVVNTRSRKYNSKDISIARVQVQSPATVLADMAGRRGGTKGRKGLTPEYDYMYNVNGRLVRGKRQHRVVPGAFLLGLSKSNAVMKQRHASRFIWPAALEVLPAVRKKVDEKISQVNLKVNALLRSK